ncbi:MAG: helicase C-terminal domain-containing protein [Pseudonocardiaceae bacterium]
MARKAETTLSALIALLRRMDAAELAALLAARPDATVAPEPCTVSELALRLGDDGSVRSAVHQLSVPQMQLVEAVQALGDGCLRAELERLLGVGEHLDSAVLDELLDGLRRLALVWADGPVLRMAPALDQMSIDPLALGQPAATLLAELTVEQLSQIAAKYDIRGQRRKSDWVSSLVDALSDPLQLHQVLGSAPPGVDETIERLVWQSPRAHAPVQFALYGTHSYGLPAAMMWLTQHGLLLPSGWDAGQMPREVALALRGEGYHPALHTAQPVLITAEVDPAPITRVSIVNCVQRMLGSLSISPAQQLATGGVGVRELRRIGRELGSSEDEVRLWLELAAAAGLVLPDHDGGVLPTDTADTWLAQPAGAQLTDLITAWQTIGSVPSYCVNAEGKPLPALDSGATTLIGPPLRADLLGLLGEYPARTAVTDLDSLTALLAWRYPLRYHSAEALGPYLVATWDEAQRLGLIIDSTLSVLGRAVATGAYYDELVERAGQILPAPVGWATFLPDLTSVVSGPPSAELARLLDLVANLETRDTASTWRLSPSSVRRALDAGHTADGLLAQLADVAGRPLPQPVEYLIKDAARRHGQLQVRAVSCVVSTGDPALAAEIAAHRDLGGLKLSLLAATVLGSAKPADETLRLLRGAGYSPVQQSPAGQTVVERVAPRRVPSRPPAPQPVVPAPMAPAALARRLTEGTRAELAFTSCEQEVKANAKALDDAQIRLLAHAIEHRLPVLIDYISSSGRLTRRIIEPIALLFDAIQAWCRLRNGERVFRLDRICAVAPA